MDVTVTIVILIKGRILFIVLLASICKLAYSQSTNEKKHPDYSFSAGVGVNLAKPIAVYQNLDRFRNTIPAWQVRANVRRNLTPHFGLAGSLGAIKHTFILERKPGTAGAGQTLDLRRTALTYLFLDIGGLTTSSVKKIEIYGQLNFRLSRILDENYSENYPARRLDAVDFGVNGQIGPVLNYGTKRVFILLEYYHGLTKLAATSYRTNSGEIYTDFVRNRSLGLLVGFYL